MLKSPRLRALAAYLACSLVAVSSGAAAGNDEGRPADTMGECTPCWFDALGVSVRGGYVFQESALGRNWFNGGLAGAEVLGEIFAYNIHRVIISAGYLRLFSFQSKGSEQVWTTASYQRVDLAAGYDIRWRMLVAGARLGGAWTIVHTRTSMGLPEWHIDDEELFFTPPEDPEVSSHKGATFGFLAGLGVGIELGELLTGVKDLLEIRAHADYVRRGPRDDFAVWAAVVFWPTRLMKRPRSDS